MRSTDTKYIILVHRIGIGAADIATATSINDDDDDDRRSNNRKPQPKLQSICIWDGGKQRSSQTHTMANSNLSTLSVYSGPDGNADDLMVQYCSFLSSVDIECTQHQQPQPQHHDHDHLTVVIFTSDANLANRCQMQLMMGDSNDNDNSFPASATPIDYQIYHSIHLYAIYLESKMMTTIVLEVIRDSESLQIGNARRGERVAMNCKAF